MWVTSAVFGRGNNYEQPLVVAHEGQTKQEPAGCMAMPQV